MKQVIDSLITTLKNDDGYYLGWQANIAVCMQDAFAHAENKSDIHAISNEGAKIFLDMLLQQ